MDRLDYYFRQKVTEAELDDGFAKAETAIQNLFVDADLVGIHFGLACSEQAVPNMTLLLTAGAAYDATGRRIRIPSNQNVNLAADYNGIATTVASVGNERWLSVFVGFTRALTDPRTDGNGLTVYFSRAETFETRVVAGVEAGSGLATRPSLDSGRILVCDVLLKYGDTTIVNAAIDTTRRQDVFVASVSPVTVREGRAKEAVDSLVTQLADHLNDATAHAASVVTYTGGPAWADGTTNPATDVESQLDKILTDLGGNAGATKVGITGAAGTRVSTSTGPLSTAIGQLHTYVDAGPLGRTAVVHNATATLTTERNVYADTSGGAFTLTLPAPSNGREVFIKDQKGTFGSNNLTLAPSGSEKIEGLAANRVLSASWGGYRVHSDGTDWFID